MRLAVPMILVSCALFAPDFARAASWHVVASPNPSSRPNKLLDVSASAANNVWAAGPNVVARWNGSAWRAVRMPGFQPANLETFSPSNTLVQGAHTIARWNGMAWKTLPNPPVTEIFSMSARSALDVWIVASTPGPAWFRCSILHWNGSKWADVRSTQACPDGEVVAQFVEILEISPTSVWIAGYDGQDGGNVATAHWNGSAWSPSFSPAGGYVTVGGIGGAPGQVWLAGSQTPRGGFADWGWVGKINTSQAWTMGGDSEGPDHRLRDVDARGSTTAWAVGERVNASGVLRTWTERWNGSTWTDLGGPNVGTGSNRLNAVKVVPGTTQNVWAVGSSAGGNRSLILHWQ
jgi:hypothetical protein